MPTQTLWQECCCSSLQDSLEEKQLPSVAYSTLAKSFTASLLGTSIAKVIMFKVANDQAAYADALSHNYERPNAIPFDLYKHAASICLV